MCLKCHQCSCSYTVEIVFQLSIKSPVWRFEVVKTYSLETETFNFASIKGATCLTLSNVLAIKRLIFTTGFIEHVVNYMENLERRVGVLDF